VRPKYCYDFKPGRLLDPQHQVRTKTKALLFARHAHGLEL